MRTTRPNGRFRRRAGTLLALAGLGTLGLVGTGITPAGAAFTTSVSCKFNSYPNNAGAVSGFQLACTSSPAFVGAYLAIDDLYAGKPPTGGATSKGVVGAAWHYGSGRSFAGSVTGTTLTATSGTIAHLLAADINHGVSGPGIPARAFITNVTSTTTATLNVTTSANAGTYIVENSDARSVQDAVTTNGSATLTSATAHFIAADALRAIGGGGCIPHGTTIASVTNTTTVVMSTAATCTGATAGEKTVSIGDRIVTTHRVVSDGVLTNGSATITSNQAGFGDGDVNSPITAGAGIPANSYIVSVTDKQTAVMNTNATASSTTEVRIGGNSATAVPDGDVVSNFGSELDLSPSLVDGSDKCPIGSVESGTIEGTWYNPGNFQATAFGAFGAWVNGHDATNGAAVAQLLYPTSVIDFSGYVTVDSNGRWHVVYPFLPTTIALCPFSGAGATITPGIGTAFGFIARSDGQQSSPQGFGTPGTSVVRGLSDITAATLGVKNPCTQGLRSDAVTPINGLCLTEFAGVSFGGFGPPAVVPTKKASCIVMWPGYPDFKCGDA